MYCPNCGKESEEDDNFCISCGEELESHKNLHGSIKSIQSYENQVDNTYYSYSGRSIENNEIQLASLGSRIVAYIIDTLVVFVLIVIIMIPVIAVQYDYFTYDDSSALVSYLLGILISFGYFILLEGPLGKGRTIGKRALKLRVVKKDQSMIGYGASFGRNILRLIDGFFFYIIGMILISDSDLNQRLGDRAADTIVIKENDYENKFRPPTSLGYN